MLEDNDTLQYIDGVATHWYRDNEMDPRIRDFAESAKKNVFLLSSESCITQLFKLLTFALNFYTISGYFQTSPALGSWERAAGYIGSIIEVKRL